MRLGPRASAKGEVTMRRVALLLLLSACAGGEPRPALREWHGIAPPALGGTVVLVGKSEIEFEWLTGPLQAREAQVDDALRRSGFRPIESTRQHGEGFFATTYSRGTELLDVVGFCDPPETVVRVHLIAK
jgi:hypothetical protein